MIYNNELQFQSWAYVLYVRHPFQPCEHQNQIKRTFLCLICSFISILSILITWKPTRIASNRLSLFLAHLKHASAWSDLGHTGAWPFCALILLTLMKSTQRSFRPSLSFGKSSPQGHNPICIESFVNILLLQSSFAHVGEAQINPFVCHYCISLIIMLIYSNYR